MRRWSWSTSFLSRSAEKLKNPTFGSPARDAMLIKPIESPPQILILDALSGFSIRADKFGRAILNGLTQAMSLSARRQQDAPQLLRCS